MTAPRAPLRRFLDGVERVGNLIPHPATLFVTLSVVVLVLSAVAAAAGVHVTHPGTGEVIAVTNLLSAAGLRRFALSLVSNFMGFAPLGPVLVSLLGLAVAEQSGWLGAVVRWCVHRTPARFLTLAVVFVGANAHTAGDVGYVLLLPLAAATFHGAGRHPVAGLAAAFAGVSGGFAANLLLSPTDLVMAGITLEAARLVDARYLVAPTASYWFLAVSVGFVTVIGTVVTERVVEPRLGVYRGTVVATSAIPLDDLERRGLRRALAVVVLLGAIVAWGIVPADGVLRDPDQPGILGSVLVRGLVALLVLFGTVPGVVYGVTVGTIRRDADLYGAMQRGMEGVAGYLVIVFFIAQFIAVLSWSNLAVVAGVHGAVVLRALDLGPIPLLVALVLVTAMLDLVLGSAAAKWAILAPVLVPMLMLVGYAPELTQTAYRVGDSLTNIITPLASNFPLVLMFLRRYHPTAGVGSLTALMLPYTLANTLWWTTLLVVWVWAGWPTGPGAPLFLGP
ncbi:MAG: AbgT family transporter [Gemmatimonadota bacterium]|nr:AbgT family transporter [Gemmatimonadota bacterium]